MEAILGATVINGQKEKVSVADISGDGTTVGIYFSAHWCPPCRGFTPVLTEYYKARKAEGKKFEIVFVSSDRDQDSFDSYFGEMPWLALDFSDRDAKEELSNKYGIRGIPTLVIVDGKTGETKDQNGRGAVQSGKYPW